MALSEQTVNKHNIRRAEVFAENGLCDLDIAFAHPKFTGYGDGECCLCGKKHIKWLFSLFFEKPDVTTMLGKITTDITRTDEVTLLPVGSKCITDWLDAVPESAAKLEALKRWDAEMAKVNRAKTKKAIQSALEKGGFDSQADLSAALYSAYKDVKTLGVSLSWRDRKKLRNYAQTTKAGKVGSAGTIKTILQLLAKVQPVIDAAKAAVPAPVEAPKVKTPVDDIAHLSDEDRALIQRGRDLWKAGKVQANLTSEQRDALVDIAKRVKDRGAFASDKQFWFFKGLLRKADPEAAPKKVLPGDESFHSASGLVGARY